VATIADAVSIGQDVVKLEGACPPAQLHQIFPPKYYEWLRGQKKVDMFVNYVKTCKPMLQANNGREIESFVELANVRDPATFTDVRDVRSYHRFQEPALVALRAAQGAIPRTSRSRSSYTRRSIGTARSTRTLSSRARSSRARTTRS
jgi:hypothetical protein